MSLVSTPLAGVAARRATLPTGSATRRASTARVVRCRAAAADAPAMGVTRVWHCPPPEKERKAAQAQSTISKLPPHVLGSGGLDPASQSPQNQQAYLGSLAERFLPVDLSYGGVRVLNVDPPVFAIPNFVPNDECDAIELSEDCKRFVRCDGAWLEGVVATSWGAEDGLKTRPPPGAFAFELPQLCVTAKGKVSDILPDSLQVDDANEIGHQRRCNVRVFLSDPPADGSNTNANASSSDGASSEGGPDIDRDAYSLKFDILDLALAPAKGTAIVTFPSFADGAADERAQCVVKAADETPVVWMDLPIAVGLDPDGIKKPVSMADVVVEKVGTEENVGDAARDKNRQEWRANVKDGADGEQSSDTGAAMAEAAKKKLDELKEQGL